MERNHATTRQGASALFQPDGRGLRSSDQEVPIGARPRAVSSVKGRATIIAEVKTQSPFGYRSSMSWEALLEIAVGVGDIIAVHTDRRYGGSFERLARARRLVPNKPILAKGLHPTRMDIKECIQAGADYVLVVGWTPSDQYLKHCMVEPLTMHGLSNLPSGTRVVWNARDVITGRPKPYTFEEARQMWPGWLCQASYIHTITDVHPNADAVLVGEHLQKFSDSITKGGDDERPHLC